MELDYLYQGIFKALLWIISSYHVISVNNESRAAKCGLKVGDQLIEVNGHSFVDILHAEGIAILKSYQNLILTIKVSQVTIS